MAAIRATVAELRAERKAVMARLSAFLHAPGNSLVAREAVVKHQRALAECDAAVEEWLAELEAAEERRGVVGRKLAQHVTAVLALRLPGTESGGAGGGVGVGGAGGAGRGGVGPKVENTPPLSPVELDAGWVGADAAAEGSAVVDEGGEGEKRRDVESIRVYADLGVASLLKSIELEIDMMGRARIGRQLEGGERVWVP